jgi:predicted anti-sigma-YlaC factor YlaD
VGSSGISCVAVREAVSALVDGEATGLPEVLVVDHLGACPACDRFAEDVRALHRRARVTVVPPVPDVTAAVLATIGAQDVAAARRTEQRVLLLRVVLAFLGAFQIMAALPALLLGDDAGLPSHAARHVGSFTLALGVGLLYAAWRPQRAAGVVPVAAALTGALLLASVIDVVDGHVRAVDELGHLPDMVGLVVVWALARLRPIRPVASRAALA